MNGEPYDVEIHQEDTGAGQWVVELRKMGGRLSVQRQVKECHEQALAFARSLADFLGVPLVERSPKQENP